MGTHDLSEGSEDICIRLAQLNDTFLSFGGKAEKTPDINGVVYAIGHSGTDTLLDAP